MKHILAAASLTMLASGALAATPGSVADGKRLHDAKCVSCHNTSVYTRKGRSVQSLDELKQQLDTCGHAAGQDLTAAQKQDLVKYLNDQFYRFP